MPISVPDLIAMRERVESDINRLEAEIKDAQETLEAIDKLEKRLRAEKPDQKPLDRGIEHSKAGRPQMTFAETVRTVVRRFSEDAFSVVNIENVLKAQGAKLPERNARIRIAMEVKRMVANKQVVIVEKGKGTNPFKYRYVGEPGKAEGETVSAASPSRFKPNLKSRGGMPSLTV